MCRLSFLFRDGNGVIGTPGFVFVQSRRLQKLRDSSTDTIGNSKKGTKTKQKNTKTLRPLSGVVLLL